MGLVAKQSHTAGVQAPRSADFDASLPLRDGGGLPPRYHSVASEWNEGRIVATAASRDGDGPRQGSSHTSFRLSR